MKTVGKKTWHHTLADFQVILNTTNSLPLTACVLKLAPNMKHVRAHPTGSFMWTIRIWACDFSAKSVNSNWPRLSATSNFTILYFISVFLAHCRCIRDDIFCRPNPEMSGMCVLGLLLTLLTYIQYPTVCRLLWWTVKQLYTVHWNWIYILYLKLLHWTKKKVFW